jgi:tetratricopeptide (TPR) repeat protein
MKTNLKTLVAFILIFTIGIAVTMAQPRVIKGTVYRDGKPASGVTVTAHKGSASYFTSFDGKYELNADVKSKWIKFEFPDKEEKLDIEGNTNEVIDFGAPAAGAAEPSAAAPGGIDLRTRAQLIQAGVKDYIERASVFEQFYNQGNYEAELQTWENLYKFFPKSSENIYIQGLKMHEELFNKATGEKKEELFNKVLEIYDNRIKYFDNEGYNLGRKATFYLKHKLRNIDSLSLEQKKQIYKIGYNWLETSVDKQGDNSEAAVLLLLNQATSVLYKAGDFKAEKVMANYDKTSKIVEVNLTKNPNDDNFQKAKNGINRTFVESGAVTCEVLVPLYQDMFTKNPNDLASLKRINYMLNRQDCSDSKLYADVAEKLYQLEPTAESAFSMARLFLKRQNTPKAIEYYDQAINAQKDKYEKASYCNELAQVLFSQKEFAKARNYARQAISLNPEWGKPYILIGKLYISSAKSIGETDTQQRMVYVLAVDQFAKAKSVDPEIAAEANKEIATYSQYFPGKEDAFFEGLKSGDSYRVGGWINETTTVRLK